MLTVAEARELIATPNLIEVGVRADEARRARHGDRVTFVRVLDVPVGGPAPAPVPSAGEVRITGIPQSVEQIESTLRSLSQSGGSRTALTGFALHDLEELGGLSILAGRLKEWGVEAISEAAIDKLANPLESIRIVRQAGLAVARLTVREVPTDPIALLERVRNLLAALPSGVLPAFAPLPRTPDLAAPTTGYDDVKLVAVARLFLDTVDTIQVDWSLYGPKLAQVALTFGANDLDAVPFDATSINLLGPRRAPLEEIRRNIRGASFVPVERNGRFEPIEAPAPAATRSAEPS